MVVQHLFVFGSTAAPKDAFNNNYSGSCLFSGPDACDEEHDCEHICMANGDSYYCKCRTGYVLNADQKTCSRKAFSCSIHTMVCVGNLCIKWLSMFWIRSCIKNVSRCFLFFLFFSFFFFFFYSYFFLLLYGFSCKMDVKLSWAGTDLPKSVPNMDMNPEKTQVSAAG